MEVHYDLTGWGVVKGGTNPGPTRVGQYGITRVGQYGIGGLTIESMQGNSSWGNQVSRLMLLFSTRSSITVFK